MDTIYSLPKYCETIYSRRAHGKLAKPLDACWSNVKPFFCLNQPQPIFQYAKSAKLYLQLMDELPIDFPWLYNLFQQGYYTTRRSDWFWAGLWTGLAIEQPLMRTAKSRGQLTRGRGMVESLLLLWILSVHKCAEVHEAMAEFSGSEHTTREQHAELGSLKKEEILLILWRLFFWRSI